MERSQYIVNLLRLYIKSKSEWYFCYRIIALSLFFLLDFIVLWLIFGYSTLTMVVFICLKVLIIIHVIFSLMCILKDYVYNEEILDLYILLVLLLVFKIGLYFLIY